VTRTLLIEDHYIENTRPRLRRVTAADGSFVRKLGQKVRFGQDVSAIACTSIYLDEQEGDVLVALPMCCKTSLTTKPGQERRARKG
jgi:hypothetical protein